MFIIIGATPRERIGITNYNREAMLPAIEKATARLVTGEYFKGW